MEEKGGRIRKLGSGLGRKEMARASFGELAIHLGMAGKVIDQAGSYPLTLGKEGDRLGQEGANLGCQEGIMGTPQDKGINQGIRLQQVIEVFTHEIVGTRRVELVVLHQRYPHRAGLTRDLDMRKELSDLDGIGVGGDGTGRTDDTHMLAPADAIHALHGRTDHTQDPPIGIPKGQVPLLNGAKGLGRSRVTG